MHKFIYTVGLVSFILGIVTLFEHSLLLLVLGVFMVENISVLLSGVIWYATKDNTVKVESYNMDTEMMDCASEEEREEVKNLSQELVERQNVLKERVIQKEKKRLTRSFAAPVRV